ncbi:uncharacterized protein LOC125450280 [Stegostoma tigrinum]|uniref:uncharacterized protein LOC125450280 n=1 Tax=Stegostoma tigrinum TaxID=3053191 RepID=UPI002870A538|nr:uncharacterized protein LOC125450280 [Stegostoma tigrinum]XP_059500809.1 uncharacterized protein LOC125450280 [Stegostoma tigrinum]
MVPTPRTHKVHEVDGTPCNGCKNLQRGVKIQSQQLFANRLESMETPNLKGKTAFIPRQRLVTPLISNTLNHLISSVENSQRKSEKPVSPNLEMLRMTPGLQQKQKILQEKHLKAKSSLDKIPVGGGVSLWPDMDDMRLTKREVVVLAISSLLLIFAVIILFEYLHGPLQLHLNYYSGRVRTFHGYHRIARSSEVALNQSLIRWHKDFWKLLDNIQQQFEVPSHCVHVTFILYVTCYIAGITVLLYYLVDNMIQKSRLTPKRIKIWLTLLVVTASWTFLMIKLLVAAHHLERAIEGTVYTLLEELADLAITGHDLRCYHDIVTYWRFRCLPPTTRGILNIFGIIKVHDISFYFHYYSLPVITALCTPVIKLLLALKTIYSRPRVC